MENYFIRFAHKSYISSYIIERQSRRERAALSYDSERKRAGSEHPFCSTLVRA